MSQFKDYANRLDDLARETFQKIIETTDALKAAEDQRKAHPMQPGLTPEAAARAAKFEAAYQTARGRYDAMRKNLPDEARRKAESIRQELTVAVGEAYAVKPSDLDRDALTLLESGILTDADFTRLMRSASTPTMRRLIAKYADDGAAKAESDGDRNMARNLRVIAQSGKEDGRSYLNAFDSMNDTFNRSLNNHAMIRFWDSLTQPIVDSF